MRTFYLYTSAQYTLIYFKPGIFKECIGSLFCRKIDKVQYVTTHVLYRCDSEVYEYWSLIFVIPISLMICVIIPVYIIIKL